TLPARHCALNGPNRVSLSPLSVAGFTVNPLSARTRCCAWLFPACPGSGPTPPSPRLPSGAAVSSSNRSTSPGLARRRITSSSQSLPFLSRPSLMPTVEAVELGADLSDFRDNEFLIAAAFVRCGVHDGALQ